MEDEYRLRLEAILSLIVEYGGIDGAHHKQWLLNEIVQEAVGRHTDEYQRWIATYQNGEYGPNTYEWDTGIAPQEG